jgi:hypothetical protein
MKVKESIVDPVIHSAPVMLVVVLESAELVFVWRSAGF